MDGDVGTSSNYIRRILTFPCWMTLEDIAVARLEGHGSVLTAVKVSLGKRSEGSGEAEEMYGERHF